MSSVCDEGNVILRAVTEWNSTVSCAKRPCKEQEGREGTLMLLPKSGIAQSSPSEKDAGEKP